MPYGDLRLEGQLVFYSLIALVLQSLLYGMCTQFSSGHFQLIQDLSGIHVMLAPVALHLLWCVSSPLPHHTCPAYTAWTGSDSGNLS